MPCWRAARHPPGPTDSVGDQFLNRASTTPGGEYKSQWWKDTSGWNFTVSDGELEQIARRNYFTAGSWPDFGNPLLLTGDQGYVATSSVANWTTSTPERRSKTAAPCTAPTSPCASNLTHPWNH